MLKPVLVGLLLIASSVAAASAAEPQDPGGIHEFVVARDDPRGVRQVVFEPRDPGGLHEFEPRSRAAIDAGPDAPRLSSARLTEIVEWLASNFDLPATGELPRVEFAPPLKIAAMRYKSMLPLAWREDSIPDPATQTVGLREVIAVYRDDQRTIYLNQRWTGATPAEMSVLVHEMVHHIQNVAGLKYDCPAAREKAAYLAQNEWLKRHDRDLESEFEIDMMTLLVTTACMN
jgi:hypothetical protein